MTEVAAQQLLLAALDVQRHAHLHVEVVDVVGDQVRHDLATLYSLIATCEAHDVDPVAYLQDVLMRVDTHPASRIDELLPHRWSSPQRWTDTS